METQRKPLFKIEWAMWANMNALYAAACIFFGGVLGATVDSYSTNDIFPVSGGAVTRWMAIVIGLFVFFIEYPRSARRNQKTNVERPGQRYIAPIIQYTFIFRIYIIRVLIYIVMIFPCCLVLSTVFGGMALFAAAVCYFLAAINGEVWKAPYLAWGPSATKPKDEDGPTTHTLPEAPTVPPPRPPPHLRAGASEPPSHPPPRPENIEMRRVGPKQL
ncbi:hypothetical protein EMCRGX_G031855 [Ephydatia muelleri]